ncbi:MAG: MarR family transcriptional regulator [Nitratireductor sp.]|uniref:MarR family winged helix-turn-helix transcriptional regulator n=1 Tax=Sphingomonadales TaxID=204457 RepID=UPI00326653A6
MSEPAKAVRPERTAAERPYRLEDHIGFVLRKANQRHLALFSARISDLTPPQFATLARLEEVGEASQNQLGALIAMDAATIKGVIDRLKARGLVELDTHKEDRRRLVVRLSTKGRETLARLRPLAFAITEETLAPLTGRERTSLMRLLAKID